MSNSPSDPLDRLTYRRITWTGILVLYAMMAAVPLLLWAASNPLAAGIGAAAVAGSVVVARWGRQAARCVRNCRGVAFDLPGTVRVTVAWRSTCDPN